MKIISKLVLACAAAGFCVAASADADSDRRLRNREEAIANHARGDVQRTDMERRGDLRRRGDVRADEPKSGVRQKVSDGARSTRNFTHRQAEKMRRFSERQNRRNPAPAVGTKEINKAPAAMGK